MVVVVVVVVGDSQPIVWHGASQQLAKPPVQAVPPRGATQSAAPCLIAQEARPDLLVRQQATNPGLPQIDLLAHCFTTPAHLLLTRTALASCTAQRTKSLWVAAVTQSQCAATAARALAMSVLSGSVLGSHLA
jgi:hypothetical protein